MRFKLWLWLVLLIIPAPFFFNCQRVGGARPAQESDAAGDDNGVVHAFATETRPKVHLDPKTLIASSNGATALAAKAGDPSSRAVVPKGLRLFALVDNSCLEEKRIAHGVSKAAESSLSEQASDAAGGAIETLAIQAYPFHAPSDIALDELVANAESDDCVIRVANDEKIKLLPPISGQIQSALAPDASGSPKASTLMASNDQGLSSQKHIAALNAYAGWNVFYSPTRGIKKDVVVGIIDTGIDYNHEDLKANIWHNAQGQVGRDLENNDDDPIDDNGHGSHVAGLIGAVPDNGVGVAGVAGKHVKLMSVKVTDKDGSAYPSTIVNGVHWAVDNGAEVINMSLGFPAESFELRDAVAYATSKGAVVVAAAGNDGRELNALNIVAPAYYTSSIPGSISVGATDAVTGQRSPFSNFSTTLVGISAPGSNGIWSTFPGGYKELEGTSMASPIVAGSAALVIGMLKSEGVTFTNQDVVNLLKSTARINSALTSSFVNGGALDLDRLGRSLKARYLIEVDGGTESPF